MHGVYNSTDRGTMQNALLGSMMSTLKGYAFGYWSDKEGGEEFYGDLEENRKILKQFVFEKAEIKDDKKS